MNEYGLRINILDKNKHKHVNMQSVGLLVFNCILSLNCSEEVHVILCKKKASIIAVTRPVLKCFNLLLFVRINTFSTLFIP